VRKPMPVRSRMPIPLATYAITRCSRQFRRYAGLFEGGGRRRRSLAQARRLRRWHSISARCPLLPVISAVQCKKRAARRSLFQARKMSRKNNAVEVPIVQMIGDSSTIPARRAYGSFATACRQLFVGMSRLRSRSGGAEPLSHRKSGPSPSGASTPGIRSSCRSHAVEPHPHHHCRGTARSLAQLAFRSASPRRSAKGARITDMMIKLRWLARQTNNFTSNSGKTSSKEIQAKRWRLA